MSLQQKRVFTHTNNKTVIFRFNEETAKLEIETSGFKGAECAEITDRFNKACGFITDGPVEKKPEYDQKQFNQQKLSH